MSVSICPHCGHGLSDDPAEGIYCENCGGNIIRQPDCKDCAWKALTLYEKWKLIWGMRISWPRRSRIRRLLDHLSPREWAWRYRAAKSTAYFEAKYGSFDEEYDKYYEAGYKVK